MQYLIQGKFLFPIVLLLPFGLQSFIEQQIPNLQVIHIGPHETTIRILRSVYNRLPSYVKAGIDQDGIARVLLKCLQQFPETWISFFMNRLDPGRIVNMSYGRKVASSEGSFHPQGDY